MKILKLLAALLLLCSAGCQTTIAPDADPVVVRSQQALEISLATVDKFVAWEYKNRKVVVPEVKAAAETLRREFPPMFLIATDLLRKYKASRDDESRRLLTNYVIKVKEYATLAQVAQ
jgi:hypothetical protein